MLYNQPREMSLEWSLNYPVVYKMKIAGQSCTEVEIGFGGSQMIRAYILHLRWNTEIKPT